MRSIFLCDSKNNIFRVYGEETVSVLKKNFALEERVYTSEDVKQMPEVFHNVEYVFSTWGMPVLTEEQICTAFPALKAVFYGAGSVQAFARPFLACGIRVFSAWAANAVPVAEYTVAQILLANKGFFKTAILHSRGDIKESREIRVKYPGNYGEKIGLIGVGMIGSLVASMLKNYHLKVLAFDPFLSAERAKELGVTLCNLKEIFSECQVISNHLANNAQTQGMLNGELFASMRPYSTFLNTGRGAQVVEADLIRVLTERKDLTAVLDVTYPEPPEAGHAFYSLENCILTPHIAGSSGDEVRRMSVYMAEEALHLLRGEPLRYEVNVKMLETMA